MAAYNDATVSVTKIMRQMEGLFTLSFSRKAADSEIRPMAMSVGRTLVQNRLQIATTSSSSELGINGL
ncbi:hypothetical protein E2C01_042072 [Portunus trituberculatus]|uniref:Uncharacterized protein n=1 Tax=Portunus trituberculatus TaxID=210409 RepID=A0A5B7FVG2_PORTR|nr:hypothetical protein [Portunus trituberculatus]